MISVEAYGCSKLTLLSSVSSLEFKSKYPSKYISFELDKIVHSTELYCYNDENDVRIYSLIVFSNGIISCENDDLVIQYLEDGNWIIYIVPLISELSPTNWMAQLGSMKTDSYSLGSMTLVDIVLPGTHDSGTFNLTTTVVEPPDSFVEIIDTACEDLNNIGYTINCNDTQQVAEILSLPWSITQRVNWYGQLQTGCRSFDYRGYYDERTSKWVIEHSLIGTNRTTPATLSAEVVKFLNENPGELVIIEYNVYGSGDINDLVSEFMKGLGKYGYHWTDGVTIPGNPTISNMILNNQRAILVAENGGQRSSVTQGIVNDYPNSCIQSTILDYDSNAIGLFAQESPDAMRKLGYQTTVDAECIVIGTAGFVVPGNTICELTMGFDCSADLMGYINQLNSLFDISYVIQSYTSIKPLKDANYFGNIWNFDHPDWSFIKSVVNLNTILIENKNNQ